MSVPEATNPAQARFNLTTAIRQLPQIEAVDQQMPWGDGIELGDPFAERDYLQTAAEIIDAYGGVIRVMQTTYANALAELNQFRQDQTAIRRYLGIPTAPPAQ